MAEPWLSIIGLGEDGPAGLSEASRAALASAEVVFGAPRHLALAGIGARGQDWPVPFDLSPLLALRGQKVAMLVSGDPFWFGAGGTVAAHLPPAEFRAYPAAGTFALVAARLGWRLEGVTCLGLHAAPFSRLRPVLTAGVRVICTLRDAAAVGELAIWLEANGFAACKLTVCEAMGGPRERLRDGADWPDITAPVAVALDGIDLPAGAGLPRASGLPDGCFAHDGQITKRPVRAITLSTLAPRLGEMLWDIGGGSGSISVEWCLAGGSAVTIEAKPERAANIRRNAEDFGIAHRLRVVEGAAPAALADLPAPEAVFVGGGGDAALHADLWARLAPGTRLVANAVTLEGEVVLAACHGRHGGSLLRIDLAEASPLGGFRGWQSSRPVVQWSVTR
ncbi:precorrin-6y C5,15-methyltransferase (decarboxylating) subunit CbiE [Rhodobacteraceae bacterium HSP-20]|jgi:precorrin-6Y C5,15-methyltransferase (decarboxylating)|uniref:Precorrin-6y C5,15-methyltransferase (Decarboxylating) subunit CbiE n=1 Tax=Paragemmobacter amnigenus TaxID=2852097 RepID=A0ABS6J5C1_9RHOB|nr:precorrin-6y C5,15-methyltransferase (decarboxylating) subunit CbiE [Rhodobacter amnigenus]MBU9698963.1 precorrin-6y C5,15-methyltransferase (decarboxylating) subunit CbiE [Rhodobacter amnigenus]MBV4390190.1 precorrin-6y C5,15-methyltransferase (decarboxylating) subunit CbiE [Rhodobacter amnigenus]